MLFRSRELARNAELRSREGDVFDLVVPKAKAYLADRAYQDKLKAALAPHLGPALRLTVRVGDTSGGSLVAAKSREMAVRQADAAEAIEDDPFVRDLVRDLGAEVVSSSIRPAEDGAPGNPSSDKR